MDNSGNQNSPFNSPAAPVDNSQSPMAPPPTPANGLDLSSLANLPTTPAPFAAMPSDNNTGSQMPGFNPTQSTSTVSQLEPVPTSSPGGNWQNPSPINSTPNPMDTTIQPALSTGTLPSPTTPNQDTFVPTDLSHLIPTEPPTPVDTNPPASASQPETMVVQSSAAAAPEVPEVPDGNRGVPKWVIGVGVGLLLAVAGASAYFILGLGQTPKPGSLPAVPTTNNQTITQPPQTPLPAPTPTPQPTATASGTQSNFGQLQGSTNTQATSAADLIRQRQQPK